MMAINMVRRARRLVLAMLLALAWNAPEVLAEQPASEASPERKKEKEQVLKVREVTVSATKTPRDPIETPGEVNIITQEELQRTQAQSLDDVLRYQPGVDSQLGPRRMGEAPVIRGLSDSRVLMTVDGIRLNFQSGHKGRLFLDVDTLKQVELVRGPASALYGSGALGGVVALTTKDPSDYLLPGRMFALSNKIGYQGVNDEWLFSPTVAARLGRQWEFLGNVLGRFGEDIRLGGNRGRLRNSSEDLTSGLGKLVWRPSPHDELKFSIQASRDAARIPLNTNSNTALRGFISDRVNRQLTYRLGYTHHNPANPLLDLGGFVYLTTLDITEFRITDRRRDDIRFDTRGFDLHNSTSLGDLATHHHRLTYGTEWFWNEQEGRRGSGANTFFPASDSNTRSFYLQDEVRLGGRVMLIPGVRWDRSENHASGRPDKSASRVSPKIGGVVKATDSLYLQANYAHGFRTPTFGELFISGTHFPGAIFVPNPDLSPERSRNVDAGFRIKRDSVLAQHDRFIFKGAYFRNTLKDFIDFKRVGVAPLRFQAVNVQNALIQGWEAELEWQVLPHITLRGNYSQAHGTDETTSRPLSSISPRKTVLGLDYFLEPWEITLGIRSQIVGSQKRVPAGIQPTPDYQVFDIYLTYLPQKLTWLQGLRVDAGIDNFTGQEYIRSLSVIPEAGMNPKVAVSYTAQW